MTVVSSGATETNDGMQMDYSPNVFVEIEVEGPLI